MIAIIIINVISIAPVDVVHDDVINDDITLPFNDYMSQPAPELTRSSHMGNLLDQLDTNIQLRRIAMEAEQVSIL